MVAAGAVLAIAVMAAVGRGRAPSRPPLSTAAARAAAAPRARTLARVRTFALAIGSGDLVGDLGRRLRGYDLVVLDGQEATRSEVAALHRGGARVLAYLDVGTIEPGRPWSARARPYRLERWTRWGEWYANVSRPGYRRLIGDVVAPAMLGKRFDGLFLDNVDMIETHRRQAKGMRELVRSLARRAHAAGGLLFAQNGEDVIAPLLSVLDGWNREDVSYTYAGRGYRAQSPGDVHAAQAALRRMARAGLLVTATDYLPAGDGSQVTSATRNACEAGAVPFVSDIELRRVPQPPLRCP